MDAPEAATFLDDQQTASGFKRLATIYAIPKAFFIWALILFVVQAAAFIIAPLPLLYGFLTGAVLISVAFALLKTLIPECCVYIPFSACASLPFFSKQRKDDAPV
jgi:hypothetical protein